MHQVKMRRILSHSIALFLLLLVCTLVFRLQAEFLSPGQLSRPAPSPVASKLTREGWRLALFLRDDTANSVELKIDLASDGNVICSTGADAHVGILSQMGVLRVERRIEGFRKRFVPELAEWPPQKVYAAHAQTQVRIHVDDGSSTTTVYMDQCVTQSKAPVQLWDEAVALWDVSLEATAEAMGSMRHIRREEYRLRSYIRRLLPYQVPVSTGFSEYLFEIEA